MPRREKDALHHIVPGILRAYKAYPDQGAELVELWNSDNSTDINTTTCQDAPLTGTSEVGLFAKFAPPTVAEGKVYLATFSHRLAVYGLRSAAAGAVAEADYDAKLVAGPLPATVEPGTSVAISITATNTGSVPWHQADDIHLDSHQIPAEHATPIEGKGSLAVQHDVLPGQTYTFNFHVLAPNDEAIYYYSWQLVRGHGLTRQPAGDGFGSPTPEWTFTVFRSECADLRQRVKTVAAQIKPGQLLPPAMQSEVGALRKDAERRHCALGLETTHVMGHEN
jgi:hypothetical protein